MRRPAYRRSARQAQQRRGAHARCCRGHRNPGWRFFALGAALLSPEWNLIITFAGLFAIVVGAALLTPVLTLWMMAGVQRLVAGCGVIARMAPRYGDAFAQPHRRGRGRFMVAVSVIIGVGVVVQLPSDGGALARRRFAGRRSSCRRRR